MKSIYIVGLVVYFLLGCAAALAIIFTMIL
jgi:hypothetical protein